MPKPVAPEEAMAAYKTIALELIRDRPELYERLRSSKRLLPSMDAYAIDLKARHDHWKDRLGRSNPAGDPVRTASEALELAVDEIRSRLVSASQANDAAPPSLDAAMGSLRRLTPSA
jgi:hypothetical protein